MRIWKLILIFALIAQSVSAFAANRISVTSGNWSTAGTWSPAGVPVAGDNITIAASHIITMNGNPGNCLSLTVNGTADWTQNRTTNVGAGGLTLNNGGVLNDANSTGVLIVSGGFTVPAGASVSIARLTISVAGTSSISGTVSFSNAGGTKTFGNISIASGGTWTSTVAAAFTFNGNMTNNGTFLSNTGVYTLAGASKTIGGSNNIIFSSLSVSGTYTNTASLQVNTNLAGTGLLTQGINSTLVIGDLTPGNIVNASASGNTVRYLVSGSMSTLDITYYNLIIEEIGGTVNGIGVYTVSGDYNLLSGAASLSNVTVLGNVSVAATSTLTIGNASPVVAGITTIAGRVNITSVTGIKRFGDISVQPGGVWNAAVAEGITVNGNLSNSGTFSANTGTYLLLGASKAINGTLTVPTLSITGTYTNNGTLSSTASLSGGGSLTQGASGVLNVSAATFNVATFNASSSGNTVNYNSTAAQNVRVPTDGSYHHLSLSGSGNKTLAGNTDINGNLTISSAFVANNFNITLGGNWSSTGAVFTPGTNTTTLDGAAQSIGRTGGETFNHLVLSGSGTKTLASNIVTNGNLTIQSALDVSATNYGIDINGNWANNGVFTQGSGTVTFSGIVAQTIGGTSATSFFNITQNNSAGASLSQHQNLKNTLTISAGTFTTTGFNFTLLSDNSSTANIAAIPSGANFAGNIIMQRYSGTGPTDWRFLCSAVSGATLADWADDFATSGFTGSTDPSNSFVSVYSYDETQLGDLDTFGYVPATNVTDPITAGKGYWVYLGPGPVTFEATGTPYTFAQSPAVTFTNSGNILNDGWNLIANPYPSAIDWDATSWTKTNMDNAIYIYNSNTGSFASYVGGVGVNGGSRYIPSQQAFWVKANASGPVLNMTENVKAAAQQPSYLKPLPAPNTSFYPMAFGDFPIPFNTNTILNSIKLTASGNGAEDEAMAYFKSGASADFDASGDAWKMWSLNPVSPNISFVINDTSDLAINTLPDLAASISVPVRFLVPSSGIYTIRRDSILMLPMSSCIFLEDLATGAMVDLRSNISYSFSISDTTTAPRFLLHVYPPLSKESVPSTCMNDSTGMAIAKGQGAGPWNYVWKDGSGGVIRTTLASFSPDTLFNIPQGIYQVEVSGMVCGTVSDTIEVHSVSQLSATVSHSNVSCNGSADGTIQLSLSGGVAPYDFNWSTGDTSASVQQLPPGSYSVSVADALGCSWQQNFQITQPTPVLAGFIQSSDTVDLLINNSIVFSNISTGASSWLWDFGDTTLPDTAFSPIHYYNFPGTYTVMLVAGSDGCSDTVYSTVVAWMDSLSGTGVMEQTSGAFVNVYYENGEPHFIFSVQGTSLVNITLFNSIGQRMFSMDKQVAGRERISPPIGHLSSGVYLAVINSPEFSIGKKIIINKNY